MTTVAISGSLPIAKFLIENGAYVDPPKPANLVNEKGVLMICPPVNLSDVGTQSVTEERAHCTYVSIYLGVNADQPAYPYTCWHINYEGHKVTS